MKRRQAVPAAASRRGQRKAYFVLQVFEAASQVPFAFSQSALVFGASAAKVTGAVTPRIRPAATTEAISLETMCFTPSEGLVAPRRCAARGAWPPLLTVSLRELYKSVRGENQK